MTTTLVRAERTRVQRTALREMKCRADRFAFLIDAQDYFRTFKTAAMRAQRSILIIGWDVNSRTLLEFPGEARPDVPNELGPFLNHVTRLRPHLWVRVLNWDSPLLYGLDREWAQQARFDWFTNPRLCFALDEAHPIGASQHQKLVVIDDQLAFVGGIDLTDCRLDAPAHRPADPRRRNADGTPYEPHHDIQIGRAHV